MGGPRTECRLTRIFGKVALSLRDRSRDQPWMPICRFTLTNDGCGTPFSLPVVERQGYHQLATALGSKDAVARGVGLAVDHPHRPSRASSVIERCPIARMLLLNELPEQATIIGLNL